MKHQRARTIAYWITTILGPASFVIGGYLHLTRDPQVMTTLAHLGYPPYFAVIMGAWKLLGAIAIVVPGFFFDLTGVAATRAFVGDGAADIAAPLVFLALVAASWALRPASLASGQRLARSGSTWSGSWSSNDSDIDSSEVLRAS